MKLFHNGLGKAAHSKVTQEPPTAFAPTDIGNLALWLDSTDPATITHASNQVSVWADKSGNGNDLSQSVQSKRPLTNTRTINARNVLDFTAMNMNKTGFISGSSFTAFVFYACDSVGGAFNSVLMVDGINDFQIDAGSTSEFRANVTASGIPALAAPAGARNGPSVIVLTYDFSAGKAAIYVDGGSPLVQSFGYINSIDTGGLNWGIARNRNGASSGDFNGANGDVLWYNAALNATQINQVGQYLSQKWATIWTDIV